MKMWSHTGMKEGGQPERASTEGVNLEGQSGAGQHDVRWYPGELLRHTWEGGRVGQFGAGHVQIGDDTDTLTKATGRAGI